MIDNDKLKDIILKYRTIFLQIQDLPTGSQIDKSLYLLLNEVLQSINKYEIGMQVRKEYRDSEDSMYCDFDEWLEEKQNLDIKS